MGRGDGRHDLSLHEQEDGLLRQVQPGRRQAAPDCGGHQRQQDRLLGHSLRGHCPGTRFGYSSIKLSSVALKKLTQEYSVVRISDREILLCD